MAFISKSLFSFLFTSTGNDISDKLQKVIPSLATKRRWKKQKGIWIKQWVMNPNHRFCLASLFRFSFLHVLKLIHVSQNQPSTLWTMMRMMESKQLVKRWARWKRVHHLMCHVCDSKQHVWMEQCACDVLVKTECQMEDGCMDLIVDTLTKSTSFVAVNCSSLCSFNHCVFESLVMNWHIWKQTNQWTSNKWHHCARHWEETNCWMDFIWEVQTQHNKACKLSV